MSVTLPEPSLVVLIGASGSGKSTFAARHFASTEVLSSDRFRGLVSDDESDLGATDAAFEVLHLLASKRLDLGKLTVVDATSVELLARQPLLELAWAAHVPPVAIVFDLPEGVCLRRNASRPDRQVRAEVIRRQLSDLHHSLDGLEQEGFHPVYVLRTPEEVDGVQIERLARQDSAAAARPLALGAHRIDERSRPMEHPNVELVRRGYKAFAEADMATLDELFADDIVWHSPGRHQLAGDYRGKQEVFGSFMKVAELTGGTFKLDIHAILADDEHAVVLVTAMGEREGKTLHDNSVQVFHIKDGKVTEQWLHPGDAYAGDEFWG